MLDAERKVRRCTILWEVANTGSSSLATTTRTRNQVNDNSEDGILVTGDRNVLDSNETLRNGGVGIHLARVVPMVARNTFLSFIQDVAAGNVVRNNTALDNRVDLKEFAECQGEPFPPLLNEWTNNTFQTREPESSINREYSSQEQSAPGVNQTRSAGVVAAPASSAAPRDVPQLANG